MVSLTSSLWLASGSVRSQCLAEMIGLDRHGSHARSRRNELIYYSYYVPYITIPEYIVNLRNVFFNQS